MGKGLKCDIIGQLHNMNDTICEAYSIPKHIPIPTSIPVLSPNDYMPKFMVPFVEKVVDVIGDGHCGFRAIAEFLGLTEESHTMIRRHLIQELKDHKND
ncbi:OTU-like cysteine protease [Medicago truncatula]|uniref:OTU-like cysteine protease n=1 Tax=Medicago truncatula TaxID=3880 RepID=G7L8P5_MEDTR|nr:OTU-like cysteine protease [Medicago truncatula]